MKQINILILFLLSPVFLFSQTDTAITALSGFEDAAGNTHLFYQTKLLNQVPVKFFQLLKISVCSIFQNKIKIMFMLF